jgi:hypothetical protein
VGAYGHKGVGHTLVETSNKGTWIRVNSLDKGTNPDLFGVSCTSLEFCVAAGEFENKESKGAVIAEEWEGSAWSLLSPVENPGNRGAGHLAGISCPKEKEEEIGWCMGAGGWDREEEKHVINQAGSETWNQATKAWAAIEAPQWPSEVGDFNAVSCANSTFCMAAGKWKTKLSEGVLQGMAMIWNGTTWVGSLASANPESSALESWLHGVSCKSASECEAVGNATNKSGVKVPVAYIWKGGKWESQKVPIPAEATSSSLEAVSCTGVEACMAVGSYSTKASPFEPFAVVLK